MPTYETPGVYIEEISGLPPSVTGFATAIPAFIGFTEQAVDEKGNDLTGVPTRIASLVEYERYFGRAPPQAFAVAVTQRRLQSSGAMLDTRVTFASEPPHVPAYLLYYSMQLFFANGGKACYVVSVGDTKNTAFDAALFVRAIATLEQYDEPTLYVFPDACSHRSGQQASDACAAVVNAALGSCARMRDRFTLADVFDAIPGGTQTTTAVDNMFRKRLSSSAEILRYGAAYFPYVESSLNFVTTAAHVTIANHTVISIAASGSESAAAGSIAANTTLAAASANHADVHTAVNEFLRLNTKVTLPPSGAIAGVYVQVDAARGVWKAPANVALALVEKPALTVDDDFGAALNLDTAFGKSINAIRAFAGRGTLVWGARTLAGNDNEWRYVSVRRFCNFVDKSVTKALETFTFEPNDASTWTKARAMTENFLHQQWQQGALTGSKPEHAFYVRVEQNQTMTANDIAEGRMIMEIGMAVVRPAEFIVLRFLQKMMTA